MGYRTLSRRIHGHTTLAPPENVLILGSSGSLGLAFLDYVTSSASLANIKRITRISRKPGEFRYHIVDTDDLKIEKTSTLTKWLSSDLDAVLYLIGTGADQALSDPRKARLVNISGFEEILRWSDFHSIDCPVLYASSIAASAPSANIGLYGLLKQEAEQLLTLSRVRGVALRFPTVVPRPANAGISSLFLNPALEALGSGRPFVWPIPMDRELRLMSRSWAALNIWTALLQRWHQPVTLALQAAIVSPQLLCRAANAKAEMHTAEVSEDLDSAWRSRVTYQDTFLAHVFGFPRAETPMELLQNATLFARQA